MLAGLVIYLCGQAISAAANEPRRCRPLPGAAASHRGRDTFLLLLGIGLAVTVFRGAYEQIGNTIALWMRDDVDRVIGGVEIGAAMFFSLNPLLVMVMTPLLLARWRGQAERGRELSVDPEDGGGRAAASRHPICWSPRPRHSAGGGRAHWLWLLGYFFDLHARRALHPAERPRHLRAARAAEARREHGCRLVSGDLQRKPRRGPGRASVEPRRARRVLS